MTVVSIKSGAGADIQRIELSDGSLFSFKTCYLPPVFFEDSGYVPGTEISTGEAEAFRFAAACLRAEKAALGLVARAEQCVFGLSRKLERKGHAAACVRAVLARLAELEIVDDRRFARLWVQSRLAQRTDTPRKLLIGLRGRGIARDDAAQALKQALHFEAETALLGRYVEKNRLIPAPDARASVAVSLKYQLKYEGFSPPVIQHFWEDYDSY
jgi:regulatory protein